MPTLLTLQRDLDSGHTTARELIEDCLARIEDPAGEGSRAFLTVYGDQARGQADLVDEARRRGLSLPPFAGVPLAIKDLYDVAGETTRCGSRVRDGEPPASRDAEVVAYMRRAGFIIVGKNNMSEFAYSGLGLNAHFPAPKSPWDRAAGRIPGGSTSGGGVAVADHMAAVALGSDTGGSCRIPAAFCGVVGFKPTSTRVSKRGVFPLSETLDSIGPLANSVSCCAVADSLLSGGEGEDEDEAALPFEALRIGVAEGAVDEGLEPAVAGAFQAALTRLSKAGARVTRLKIPEFSEMGHIFRNGSIVGAEALALHRPWLKSRRDRYDPWVLSRIESAAAMSGADLVELLAERRRVTAAVALRTQSFDAIAMPTVAVVAPRFDALGDFSQSFAINRLVLRNTVIGNFLDRPSISIPCHAPGEAPVGFMLFGETGQDRRLFAAAKAVEAAVRIL
jgi:aspartyl-tRNA(Asn)/glutamyl-tRNA(Gln) amidotransferase subunit A